GDFGGGEYHLDFVRFQFQRLGNVRAGLVRFVAAHAKLSAIEKRLERLGIDGHKLVHHLFGQFGSFQKLQVQVGGGGVSANEFWIEPLAWIECARRHVVSDNRV